MKRRALLASVVPLLAGCFSGTKAESAQPTDEGTETPTPGETPTETSRNGVRTETPTGDRTAAIDRIDTAQDRLREAVYIYTGGVSNDLLDVSADASEFDDRAVLLKLADAQVAIQDAEEAAATAEQRRTVEALGAMRRFLMQATDLQAWLIDGHDAVADAVDALADEKDDATVADKLAAVKRAVENSAEPLSVVTDDVDASAAEVTDALTVGEYERKRTQFEHERTVVVQLHEDMSTIQSARDELDAARTRADNGDYFSAEEAADRASEDLNETVDRLADLDGDLPSRAGAFQDLVADVLDVARDYAAEAEDLREQYN